MDHFCGIGVLLLIYTLNIHCYIHVVDITSVIDKYVLICGFQLCNNSLSSYRGIVQQDFNVSVCPKCSCDLECLKRKDCCPDFYFQGPEMTCTSANVINSGSNDKYLMISSCPIHTKDDLKERCSGYNDTKDLLQNPPVMSNSITFRNDHRAECNNISSTTSWNLDFNCIEFVDFNFLSTYEAISDAAMEARCNITYKPENVETDMCSGKSQKISEFIIDECNITGTWDQYDSDIELACKTIESSFSVYKNVFCFMCNPPDPGQHIIDKCNQTGKWFHHQQEGLLSACQNLPTSSLTNPYKNSFCYLCNVPANYTNFIDMKTKKITFSHVHDFQYTIETEQFDSDFLLNTEFELQTTHSTYPLLSKNITDEDRIVDIEDLLSYYNKSFNGQGFCDLGDSCSCQLSCLFNGGPCCMELLLRHNTTCIQAGHNSYLASKHCLYNNNLTARCHSNDTLFENLPFSESGTTYKNIYCFLCNEFANSSTTHEYHSQWIISINCQFYVFIDFFLVLSDLYQYTSKAGCVINFAPTTKLVSCPSYSSNVIDHCNWNATDVQFNKEVMWACERLDNPSLPEIYTFRNIFCFFCNPPSTPEYSTRLTTVPTTVVMESTTLPHTVPSTTNGITISRASTTPVPRPCWFGCDEEFADIRTFRSIFAIRSYRHTIPDKNQRAVIASCPAQMIYDAIQERCRSLECYPGKIMRNATCVPLLEITSNLGYILRLRIDAEINYFQSSVLDLLQKTKVWITDYIGEYLGLSFVEVPSVSVITNMACREHLTDNETVTLYVSLKVFINQTVNRLDIEENLVSIDQKEFNVSQDDASIVFKLFEDEKSNDIEYMIEVSDHYQFCIIMSKEEVDYTPYTGYRFVPASILLLCNQIELDSTQYIVNWPRQKVYFPDYSFTVEFGRILMAGHEKIRICETDFKANVKKISRNSGWTFVLNLVMRVFSIISLVSLLLTFLSYLMFPKLRTLPGKNNMCLVFALFWTLFLFTFGLEITENEYLCKIVGIMLHYFWLASFGCLNICSFHMFRTFKNIHLPSTDKCSEKKRLIKYVTYSYGLPLIIVGINIAITSGVTRSKSIGYGDVNCFLTFIYAVWSTFLIPVSLVCVSNAILFAVTFYKIKTLPKVHNESAVKQSRVHTAMYFKLFSLTGITWILQLIEAFLPMSIFTFVISILNCLQGMFIFISYVCNYRVFHLCFERCCSTKEKESSDTGLSVVT